ncbi:uncharacterized protein BCR38DRAFT_484878 [Pseudomassariella vexata]|uniref:Uncharacterized protein n=1 Tax=Pseudomassariella vexata TaxID=1141098 RepID=A0A1Y2E1N1_9PEZI|nr:uncharacterized protein BCR38DRAFT_484878 [Pseudomassariella vexata]ORY65458.1 hypothetical protein BCR38DRAFT_484878 [Pseudomassariella vexata]
MATNTLRAVRVAGATPAIALPPQNTPFSYAAGGDPCRLSVYCPQMTNLVYSSESSAQHHPLSGNDCIAVQTTEQFGTRIGHETKCFPESYFAIFGQEYVWLNGAADGVTVTNEGADSTLAYPGNACLSGYTTACTTTLFHQGSLFSQAWCCPSGSTGSWTCATATADYDEAAPQRLCKSLMTESTQVWMSWDPPYTWAHSKDLYTWYVDITSESPQYAASVYHKVFPLQLMSTETEAPATTALHTTLYIPSPGSSSNKGAEETSPSSPADARPDGGLSSGKIVRISVSLGVFFVVLIITIVYLYLRRKRIEREPEGSPAAQEQETINGKPELEGSGPTYTPKAELDATVERRQPPIEPVSPPGPTLSSGAISPHITVSPTTPEVRYPSVETVNKEAHELAA